MTAEAEILHAAALQFVRKVSGFNKSSAANEAAFQAAVEEITATSDRLKAALAQNQRTVEESGGRGRQGPCPQRRAVREVKD